MIMKSSFAADEIFSRFEESLYSEESLSITTWYFVSVYYVMTKQVHT